MKPLVVLDVDGVCNSGLYLSRLHPGGAPLGRKLRQIAPEVVLDPVCLEHLSMAHRLVPFDVVLSSGWRAVHTMARVESALRFRGFPEARIVAKTDERDVRLDPETGAVLWSGRRPEEIRRFLTRTEMWPSGVPERFAIVDDDPSDFGDLAPRLVRTSFELGFTRMNVDDLVRILRR